MFQLAVSASFEYIFYGSTTIFSIFQHADRLLNFRIWNLDPRAERVKYLRV